MTILSLASQLVSRTKAQLYSAGLQIATGLGLPVTSWQTGDPTRSLYYVLSEAIEANDNIVAQYVAAGFLEYAPAAADGSAGFWLKLVAKQVFNVTVPDPTYASADCPLTNAGGGVYDFEAGDITAKCTATGKTYTNTTGGHLGALSVLTLTFEANEAGSGSSAGIGEIDDLVTTFLGVTISNPTAAVGVDSPSAASVVTLCRNKVGSLSPNGPSAAYVYVALASDLTGTTNVARARDFSDSDTGDVTLYIASASGAATSGDRTKVEAAIATWATPLCITPTVALATEVTVAITYTLYVYRSVNKTSDEVEAAVLAALDAMFAARPIGGDIVSPATTGKLYRSLVESTIKGVFSQAFHVTVAAPAGDTALTNSQVAKRGTVTPTVVFEDDP